jgi:hypothetical protein
MKNYAEHWTECENFITKYKVVGNKIIIRYADTGKKEIPYTESNEQSIIDIMETQASNAADKPLKKAKKYFALNLMVAPFLFLLSVSSIVIAKSIMSYIYLFCFILSYVGLVENFKRIKEIKKMKFFLDNKNELNSSVDEYVDIYNNVNEYSIKNTKKEVCNNKFNINNIDDYSLSELKKIKEEIVNYNNLKLNKEIEEKEEEKILRFRRK